MTSQDLKWRERYYELEKTVEQMITGFERVLSKSTVNKTIQPKIASVHIDALHDALRITCCASHPGVLEYCFDFIQGENLVKSTGFILQNSVETQVAVDRCVVTVQVQRSQPVEGEESTDIATIEVALP